MNLRVGMVTVILTLLHCLACTTPSKKENTHSGEVLPIIIPLSGTVADRDTEISGLAWFQDQLIILPQYLGLHNAGQHLRLFSLERADLESFVRSPSVHPLSPQEIQVEVDADLQMKIKGFEGFEAIVFYKRAAYLLIEAETERSMSAFLVKGEMKEGGKILSIQSNTLTEIPLPVQLSNMAHEAMVRVGEDLIVIYEANGAQVNAKPVAYKHSLDLSMTQEIPLESIEYRITDATEIDDQGRFWVTNYFWNGEKDLLRPKVDDYHVKFGKGLTHSQYPGVERLVQLELRDSKIYRSNMAPIDLVQENTGKNWEGIVRLGNHGFLIATDKHPKTLLAFIPFGSSKSN